MSDKTGIEWTDATWNPVRGCTRVSEGCRNCYAERVAARFSGPGQAYEGLAEMRNGEPRWTGEVRVIEKHLLDPVRWQRPRRIFVNSMSDLFHERLSDADIGRVFDVMADCFAFGRGHVFQILTKRPERMRTWMNSPEARRVHEDVIDVALATDEKVIPWPLPNVWLGVSAEDQRTANSRVPTLIDTPAAVRFVSAEPLLGPIDFTELGVGDFELDALRPPSPKEVWDSCWSPEATGMPLAECIADAEEYGITYPPSTVAPRGLDWVIVGGESGPGARPVNADWVRAIRDACVSAGTGFFFKQWGEWSPWLGKVGKHRAGRELDGRTWDEFPAAMEGV